MIDIFVLPIPQPKVALYDIEIGYRHCDFVAFTIPKGTVIRWDVWAWYADGIKYPIPKESFEAMELKGAFENLEIEP